MGNEAFKLPNLTKPQPSGPYRESLVPAITYSTGAGDAGKIPVLGPDGKLDPSFGGGSGPTPSMTFSASPSVVEIGSTVASVTLNWTLSNITAISQIITGSGIIGSVSINPGTLTYLVTGPF